MSRCTDSRDMTEQLLKAELNIYKSINQSKTPDSLVPLLHTTNTSLAHCCMPLVFIDIMNRQAGIKTQNPCIINPRCYRQ